MNVEDFKHANCNLFRIPPINVDEVRGLLEETILNAWKRNNTATDAINSVLNNQKVLDILGSQVGESLEYQRQIALDSLKSRELELQEQRKRKIKIGQSFAEGILGDQYKNKESEVKTVRSQVEEVQEKCDIAQAELYNIKGKVDENMDFFGGEEGLKTILEINQMILEGDKKEKKPYDKSHSQDPDLEEKKYNPQNEKGLTSKALSSIWRVLNYKIW